MITSNLGCHVLSVFTKDREGNFGDVVLGFENVEDCWHGDGSYMGRSPDVLQIVSEMQSLN